MTIGDNIKSITPPLVAAGSVFYGMFQLFKMIELGLISPDAGLAILGPIISTAVLWVFQRDNQAQATKAIAAAVTQGAKAQAGTLQDEPARPAGS